MRDIDFWEIENMEVVLACTRNLRALVLVLRRDRRQDLTDQPAQAFTPAHLVLIASVICVTHLEIDEEQPAAALWHDLHDLLARDDALLLARTHNVRFFARLLHKIWMYRLLDRDGVPTRRATALTCTFFCLALRRHGAAAAELVRDLADGIHTDINEHSDNNPLSFVDRPVAGADDLASVLSRTLGPVLLGVVAYRAGQMGQLHDTLVAANAALRLTCNETRERGLCAHRPRLFNAALRAFGAAVDRGNTHVQFAALHLMGLLHSATPPDCVNAAEQKRQFDRARVRYAISTS